MKRSLLLIWGLVILLTACNNGDDGSLAQNNLPYLFEDGFETINGDMNELFPIDESRWTHLQLVHPNNGENVVELNEAIVNEGEYAIKLISKPADEILSKIDIEKGGFFAPVGSNVTIEADFFINSADNLKELFLIDLECCSCWDPDVPDNQCPGIRLKFGGNGNYLSIERGKILGSTMFQSDVDFPMNEWVTVRWELKLSPEDDGENRLFINGQQIINEVSYNMPNPAAFKSEFENFDINFELQEPLGYERVQIGATANPTEHEVEMYVDNFRILIE